MKVNKWMSCILGMAIIMSSVGCNNEKVQGASNEATVGPTKYVHTKTLTSESYTNETSYSGYVGAKETKKYAFEISGTVDSIAVEKGDYITNGQVLATLDTTTIQLGVANSKQDVNLATNKIGQAQSGIEAEKLALEKIKMQYDSNITQLQSKYDLQKEICEGNEALYEAGAMSKIELENAQVSLDLLKEQLEHAKAEKESNISIEEAKITQLSEQETAARITLNQAQVGVSKNQEMLNQSVLKSTIEGYVLEVPVKSGEVAAAGTPIVIVKTTEEIVSMGVPAEDYHTIQEGMKVEIETDGESIGGIVTKVAPYPDETTRTYNIEIEPEKQDLVLGSLVTVKLKEETGEGCFVPLRSVVNMDGVNYVYKVSKNEANEYVIECVEVTLGKVKNEYVLASNLTEGTIIVDEDVKDIKENEIVSI